MVKKMPLLTVLSGPVSSMTGAAFLSGTKDAIVVDIGDITTNVGVIKSGLPCMSSDCFKVGYAVICYSYMNVASYDFMMLLACH